MIDSTEGGEIGVERWAWELGELNGFERFRSSTFSRWCHNDWGDISSEQEEKDIDSIG